MTAKEQIREQITNVLEEGRANPAYLRKRIDELDDAQDVQSHLRVLITRGEVRKVCRSLYELDTDERTPTPESDTQITIIKGDRCSGVTAGTLGAAEMWAAGSDRTVASNICSCPQTESLSSLDDYAAVLTENENPIIVIDDADLLIGQTARGAVMMARRHGADVVLAVHDVSQLHPRICQSAEIVNAAEIPPTSWHYDADEIPAFPAFDDRDRAGDDDV